MNLQWADLRARGLPPYRTIVFIALTVLLIWLVTTRTLVAYLVGVAPDAALTISPSNATALLEVVERELQLARSDSNQSAKAKDPDPNKGVEQNQRPSGFSLYPMGLTLEMEARIRTRAELAVRSDPLNAKAFRILGQLSDRTPDEDRTKALMQAAVRRSLHESVAVYWMMQRNYLDQDYRGAIRYADILLRTRPQLLTQVVPVLGKIAETSEGADELKKLLAQNPPWRLSFFLKTASHNNGRSDASQFCPCTN